MADFKILNYNELDALALQELIEFSEQRGGFFREDMRRFSIRKRADIEYLQAIFDREGLHVELTLPQTAFITTSHSSKVLLKPAAYDEVIRFGKHQGTTWGALPDAYLQWVRSSMKGVNSDIATSIIIYKKIVAKQGQQ